MAILLYVLYALLGLVALGLVVALFLPAEYHVEKSIVIARPPAQVFAKIADLAAYREWNPWQIMEPTSEQKIAGKPGTAGHSYYWNGKKIGEGRLTLRSAQAPSSVEFDLEFMKPWKASADDTWSFSAEGKGAKVVWRNSGKLPYPIARLMGVLINKNLNKQFEEGLANLKALCEK